MSFNKVAGIYDQLQDIVNDTQSDMTKFVEGNSFCRNKSKKSDANNKRFGARTKS